MSSNINCSHSFRKNKDNIQSITPIDPSPRISFESFIGGYTYLDDIPYKCYEFVDDFTIRIIRDGYYDIQIDIFAGNNIPGSYLVICVDNGGPIFSQPCIVAASAIMVPFNNGFHTHNCGLNVSGKARFSPGDLIVVQYACDANTDIYPSSFISIKFLNN